MNNTVHNIACVFALGLSALAAVAQTGHVDPPGWWGDLEEGKVEVLVSHPDLGVPRDVDTDNNGVTLKHHFTSRQQCSHPGGCFFSPVSQVTGIEHSTNPWHRKGSFLVDGNNSCVGMWTEDWSQMQHSR